MEITAEKINKESLQKLLEYLPYFLENNKFEKEDDKDRVKGLLEYPEYADKVNEFLKAVYDTKFLVKFKWQDWDRSRQLVSDFEQIAKEDILTLRMLLTALIRNDRICIGSFLEALEYGTVTQILLRLEKIVSKSGNEIVEVYNISTEKPAREVMYDIYSYLGELAIHGGWGYTQKDAVVIDINDPIVDKSIPFNGIDLEYIFAKHRTYLELITARAEDDRFSDMKFETIRQELINGDNDNKYDRLILKVSALRSQDYKELKEIWENNFENDDFDQDAHWVRDEELRIHVEREFWFEISSFYGQNFVILDESDENGGSATIKMV